MGAIKSCYNCEDREVGCHGYCEKYLQEKAKHNEIIQNKKKSESYNRYKAAKNHAQAGRRHRKKFGGKR